MRYKLQCRKQVRRESYLRYENPIANTWKTFLFFLFFCIAKFSLAFDVFETIFFI